LRRIDRTAFLPPPATTYSGQPVSGDKVTATGIRGQDSHGERAGRPRL